VLSAERIEELAALTTVDGLKTKTGELKELAAPYIAKAYESEGRKELVAEASDLANEKVIKPVREKVTEKVEAVKVASKEYAAEKTEAVKEYAAEKKEAVKGFAVEKKEAVKEYATEKVLKPTKELAEPYIAKSSELAAPYIAKSSEIAAPYIAKMETKRAEIVASKRYEKAVAALQTAREHPMEMATELKSKAIDLLKYDNIASYRDYIQSEEFQADTMRLVKVELPAIASDAAARGIDQVKTAATSLAGDIEAKKGQIVVALEKGYSAARKVELADLKEKAKALTAELQAEMLSGIDHVKAEGFSLADTLARMKKMVGAIDTLLLSPLLTGADDGPEAPTELAPAHLPSSGTPDAKEDEDETFDDAQEQAAVPVN